MAGVGSDGDEEKRVDGARLGGDGVDDSCDDAGAGAGADDGDGDDGRMVIS